MLQFKLLLVFVLALKFSSSSQEKVFLTVYYESQCPDSIRFIDKQLVPTINLLHEYITLKLVPFGKAKSIRNGYGGFKCQHGPTECTGNIVQSCALDIMQKRNDLEKVSYVQCEMQTQAGTRWDMKCVRRAGLSPSEVQQCAESTEGINLQLDHEYQTKLIRPTFIPTITIGQVFNRNVQNSALHDLTGTICSVIRHAPPCAQHYNSLALDYVY
ncbi:GILT-like protein 1 [Trichoplusia ni]|uniref:GILT-like protein 1 n=1 Tax=Trichoplusia ni TaxID=7111 RepID=A0A7E5VSC4_TRINI|nr:GILT-like protein 1 [Trichoplusia ni]